MKTNPDLITNKNKVLEGLNFLVHIQWWRSFLSKNQNIQNLRQMRLPSFSPLDCLYERDIMQTDHNASEQEPSQLDNSYRHIIQDAKKMLNSMKRQLKQSQIVQNNENLKKRNKVSCAWFQQINFLQLENIELFLYSPKVKQEMIQLFEIGDQSWVVVAPELYCLIWLKEAQEKKIKKANQLTALPVIMTKANIQNFDKTITFQNKQNIEVFFNNFPGKSFIFKGFIDSNISINELVKYLDDGCFRLMGGSKSAKSSQQSNIVLQISNNPHILYQFKQEKANDNLGWLHFSQIKQKSLEVSLISQITVFKANYQGISGMQEQDQQKDSLIFDNLHKKRKQEAINGDKYDSTEAKPIISQQNNALAEIERNDMNSSTQQETPFEERQHKNLTKIQNIQALSDENRIPYSIWKQPPQIQYLVVYGQANIAVPKIFRPYSEQPIIVLKEEGKKTILPRACNLCFANAQKQLVQRQSTEAELDLKDQAPSQWVKRQLQILALQILGIEIAEKMQDAEKVQQIALVKSNSENESKTCKNEFMDEFDCEQSREF